MQKKKKNRFQNKLDLSIKFCNVNEAISGQRGFSFVSSSGVWIGQQLEKTQQTFPLSKKESCSDFLLILMEQFGLEPTKTNLSESYWHPHSSSVAHWLSHLSCLFKLLCIKTYQDPPTHCRHLYSSENMSPSLFLWKQLVSESPMFLHLPSHLGIWCCCSKTLLFVIFSRWLTCAHFHWTMHILFISAPGADWWHFVAVSLNRLHQGQSGGASGQKDNTHTHWNTHILYQTIKHTITHSQVTAEAHQHGEIRHT